MRKHEPVDRLVVAGLLGHIGAILFTDFLIAHFKGTTYSTNARKLFWFRVFFWYLALHMTWSFRYDPLTLLARKIDKEMHG